MYAWETRHICPVQDPHARPVLAQNGSMAYCTAQLEYHNPRVVVKVRSHASRWRLNHCYGPSLLHGNRCQPSCPVVPWPLANATRVRREQRTDAAPLVFPSGAAISPSVHCIMFGFLSATGPGSDATQYAPTCQSASLPVCLSRSECVGRAFLATRVLACVPRVRRQVGRRKCPRD